ncbi:CopG family transcriptional regulator [Paraeggerthella hongkongensis]|uniref:type II toxin-antitoxin system BrnA family antitoxin n=1 Tax=unclassified Paraeggerthella TaxID=2641972 RepID=UPI000DF7B4E6|nr:CopG family transcriptional regulator [Paraeggerthella hongkongensis]
MNETTDINLVERFDNGNDVNDYFDFDKASRPNRETRKVNVDMPEWMIEALDEEAGRLSVNRQAVIKFWLSDRIDEERSKRAV